MKRNRTIRTKAILAAGAGLGLVFSFLGTERASASGLSDPPVSRAGVSRLAQSCGPGRPCPPPPPVQRGSGNATYPRANLPATASCPPMTVYNPRVGRCVADPYGRRRIQERPPITTGVEMNDRDERSAANLVNAALRGLDCGQAGDALRRLTNQVLQLQASGTRTSSPGRPGGPGDEVRRRWREHVQSPVFWKKVWNRMADVYRSCNRECFDDGVSVGTLSATAYCAASVAVAGLPGPGYLEQTPLPVCETSIFAGCVKSYGETAAGTSGCSPYTRDQFEGIFAEYQSQDCHL